jgi:hypothetical protein
MSARTYASADVPPFAVESSGHSDNLRWELAPGERAGAPLVPRRKRWWLRGFVLLAVGGGGWACFTDPEGAWGWASKRLATAASVGETILSEWRPNARLVDAPPPPLALAPLQLLEPATIEAAAATVSGSTIVPADHSAPRFETEAAPPPPPAEKIEKAAKPANIEKPAPLPPLPALTDPLQKRAEAVGLHPELSRALLQSLTATDFKNAAAAIKKAIAETPEDAVLVWPPQPKPGLARFRIHFVPGISAACRRYVVGVGKNGWLTTALPMERCGIKPKPPSKPAVERAASTSLPKR